MPQYKVTLTETRTFSGLVQAENRQHAVFLAEEARLIASGMGWETHGFLIPLTDLKRSCEVDETDGDE